MTTLWVSQRSMTDAYGEVRDALDRRWHALFIELDIIPVLLPNEPHSVRRMMERFPAGGVLLTGGNDSPEREQTEMLLLEQAMAAHLPVLGVCHGMQMIQRYFGVEVKPVPGHVSAAMTIAMNGTPAVVNSYHDLGATVTVPELEVWAQAADGVVKAVRHASLPITGIMWHPERCSPFEQRDKDLFNTIFRSKP